MAPEQGPARRGEVQTVPRSWIYTLSKSAIIAEMEVHGLDTEGTLDELRSRLSAFVDESPASFRDRVPPPPPPPRDRRVSEASVANASLNPFANQAPPSPEDRPAKVINAMRKWGLQFDGKDPWAFLERVEELKDDYELTDSQFLKGLPVLLKGDAQVWCRVNRRRWVSWEDFAESFRAAFLPHADDFQLLEDVHARKQQAGETFFKYSTALIALMLRAGIVTEGRQLEYLYRNMHFSYQWRIKRNDVRSIQELSREAATCERLAALEKAEKKAREPARDIPSTAAVYNRDECCWRCKQRGHTRFDCRRAPKKFCSQCGKDGVLTRNCHPPPGNAPSTGEATATPRSPN